MVSLIRGAIELEEVQLSAVDALINRSVLDGAGVEGQLAEAISVVDLGRETEVHVRVKLSGRCLDSYARAVW